MEELLKLPEFTWEEIQGHTDAQSCWCVMHGLVYDLTKFLDSHPGGAHVILEVAGQDATEAFEDIGHTLQARVMADEYIVGRLKGATDIRKCTAESRGCCSISARDNKGGVSMSLIVAMILVALIGIWAYFHFQDDGSMLYQRISTIQEAVVE